MYSSPADDGSQPQFARRYEIEDTHNTTLYNSRPRRRERTYFKDHSWYTVDGYLYEADKLARCILAQDVRYKYTATINVEEDLSAKDVAKLWAKISRNLNRKGVVALWVREVSKTTDRVHYHLLIREGGTKDELKKAINESVPKGVDYHSQVKRLPKRETYLAVRYMVKAKTPLDLCEDRWKAKRTLFHKKTGIRKYGTIGKFWDRPKAKLWAGIIATEKRIAEGLLIPGAAELALKVAEQTGEPLTRVRRAIGFHARTYFPEAVVEKRFPAPCGVRPKPVYSGPSPDTHNTEGTGDVRRPIDRTGSQGVDQGLG